MNTRSNFAQHSSRRLSLPGGYTLVEILVALTLTLILMTAVVKVFGDVGPGIANARKALEQFDRLRTAAQQLNSDLNNVTARLDGRAGRPEEALGYFELIEGSYLFLNPTTPVNPTTSTSAPSGYPYYAIQPNPANSTQYLRDYSVGERGDILMFTARNAAHPYVGRYNPTGGTPQTVPSDVAEIAWYLRGNRLHRRFLLVMPGAQALTNYTNYTSKANYYNDNDISARLVNGKMVPNSLADLVKRQNRFAHAQTFPFDVRGWGTLGLPTLAECTDSSSTGWMTNWQNGSTPTPTAGPPGEADMWNNSSSGTYSVASVLPDQWLNRSSQKGQRISDDVVLTNVIGFDVKVWEPAANNGAGGYVDLGSNAPAVTGGTVTIMPNMQNTFQPPSGPTYYRFNNGGIAESGLSGSGSGSTATARVYDSGCFADANELGNGQATNGLEDSQPGTPGYGIVDDLTEYILTSGPLRGFAPGVPPYPVPLRGIQIKIRCFEPDSRQIREVTIEHDFLPK